MAIIEGLLGKAILGPLVGIIEDVVDRLVPDVNKARELKAELTAKVLAQEKDFAKAASEVIVAEATGRSWIQRNWRPMLMIVIMAILVWNGILTPIVYALFGVNMLELSPWEAIPTPMWGLLTVGVGGYIGARTIEKIKL